MNRVFEDRSEAGRLLAARLKLLLEKNRANTIVLALPRGGVPVAQEIAQALDVPFDVLIVRKIGHPFHREYGIGALTEGGFSWMDPNVNEVSETFHSQVRQIIENEKQEIERRVKAYRQDRPLPSLDGKTVIIVDDGLATGVTARAASQFAKSRGAKKVILAIPVCSQRTADRLRSEIDEVVCLNESSQFFAVGQFYRNFEQVSDREVMALLPQIKKTSEPQREILVPNDDGVETRGFLKLPKPMLGFVIFAHGSGSGRFSSRNRQVATHLNQRGIGTLLFDLLTDEESRNHTHVFDIPLLGARLVSATRWIRQQDFGKDVPIGYFGASTGGGAALWAAAESKNPISAIVSRGGRPDLAMARLSEVNVPTLLIVGDRDLPVVRLNEQALAQLKTGKMILIPGATHLFEEPGTLEQVAEHAAQWFEKHFSSQRKPTTPAEDPEPLQPLDKVIEKSAVPLRNRMDLYPLIQKLSQSRIVMLGESSHGTQEFYEWRRLITQELIARYGFNFMAVEGDWPPCAELNRFVKAQTQEDNVREVLQRFQRWPTWMWANMEVARLGHWMRTFNEARAESDRAGFFGLDVYSLFESMDEVLKQLQKVHPPTAQLIKMKYECFDPFQQDEKAYATHLAHFPEGCEKQVIDALNELLHLRLNQIGSQDERLFDAEQNARIVKNAAHYYSAMIHGDEDSWNVRDQHMLETLEILLHRHGPASKAIVWAHNTHVGDYRATNMVHQEQINIGGLARQRWGEGQVALLGFGTFEGEVIASHAWDGPMEIMTVPPGRANSYEAYFHKAAERLRQNSFYLWLRGESRHRELSQVLGHRAIGVVYHPAYERFGNYVPTSLFNRYDAFIFVDKTTALTPLHQKFLRQEIPETWPTGV